MANDLIVSGMPFYQAVHITKRQDRIIKGVHIWYSDRVNTKKNCFDFVLFLN